MAIAEEPKILDHTDAGWFPDPERQHRLRYYDGASWTGHVTHFGPTPCSGCSYHDSLEN